MKTQYKKIIEDLFSNLSKTVLVILSITLGVFSLGVILDTYTVTDREMTESYRETSPASFVISVDDADDELLNELREEKDIALIGRRKVVVARIYSDVDKIFRVTLYVINDDDKQKINTFYSLEGNDFTSKGEILLENSSLSVVKLSLGDSINVKVPNTEVQSLKISGVVQADGTNPAWMHEEVIGYISEESFSYMNAKEDSSEILAVVSPEINTKSEITEVSKSIQTKIENLGYKVNYVLVPEPDVHPNASQMNAILLLFRIFGTLALILSGVLIYSIITSILQKQIKHIAIMKSMGATRLQISLMYYFYVTILGAIAAVIAIPPAKIISQSLCDFTSSILVFSVRDYSVPIPVYLIQAVIAIIIPTLAATIPIIKGCRITIADGLYDKRREKKIRKGKEKRLLIKHSGISVGFHNTFRKPTRLIFSVFTLALGGSILIASINVSASLEKTLSSSLSNYNMDTQFVFSENYSDKDIASALSEVKGIESFKSTSVSEGSIIDDAQGDAKTIIYDNSKLLTQISIVHTRDAELEATYKETENAFYESGLDVTSGLTIESAEKIFNKHLFTVASFLIGASVIVILVGIISMVSLSGINVSDRIKELGILRSFGATSHSVFTIVFIENLITGLLGILSSLVVAIPLSIVIGQRFGEIFLGNGLLTAFSPSGAVIWILMTATICTLVSAVSVQKAIKPPVNEVLSYE